MFMGRHIKRWKVGLLVGSLPLLQLGTCTADQQDFWRSVQAAGETFITGLVSMLFVVIQNRPGDDIPGIDSVTWAVKHVVVGLF